MILECLPLNRSDWKTPLKVCLSSLSNLTAGLKLTSSKSLSSSHCPSSREPRSQSLLRIQQPLSMAFRVLMVRLFCPHTRCVVSLVTVPR